MTLQDQILPCPFCGGEANPHGKVRYSETHEAWFADGTQIREAFFCHCINCGASTQGLCGQQTPELAIAKWNRRAAASLVQQAPEGYKLVPVEPTEAMQRAAFDALEVPPGTHGYTTGTEARNAVYAAMLAAAPATPPVQPRELSDDDAERTAFEVWADDQGFPLRRLDTDDGGYLDLRTHGAWDAWRARSLLSASRGGGAMPQASDGVPGKENNRG